MNTQVCSSCNEPYPGYPWRGGPAWWSLCGWKGIWGFFCPKCHDEIHPPNGQPLNEDAIKIMKVKLKLKRSI